MNILETIMNNPEIVNTLAGQFGLSNQQAQAAMNPMLKQLASSLRTNMGSQGGLESLLRAVQGGGHTKYLNNLNDLGLESTALDGNNILGHVLGSKDVSRQLANKASSESGVGYEIAKKLLPLVASVVMGQLGQRAESNGLMSSMESLMAGRSAADSNQLTGFASLLDLDGDGSFIDDVASIAGKFLR